MDGIYLFVLIQICWATLLCSHSSSSLQHYKNMELFVMKIAGSCLVKKFSIRFMCSVAMLCCGTLCSNNNIACIDDARGQ